MHILYALKWRQSCWQYFCCQMLSDSALFPKCKAHSTFESCITFDYAWEWNIWSHVIASHIHSMSVVYTVCQLPSAILFKQEPSESVFKHTWLMLDICDTFHKITVLAVQVLTEFILPPAKIISVILYTHSCDSWWIKFKCVCPAVTQL